MTGTLMISFEVRDLGTKSTLSFLLLSSPRMVRLEFRMTDSNAILLNISPFVPSLLHSRQIALNARYEKGTPQSSADNSKSV